MRWVQMQVGLPVQPLKEPEPLLMPWAVAGLQASSDHLLVLDASGQVLELDWVDGRVLQVLGPPQAWRSPQSGLLLRPQTWYGEGRILPLAAGGVLRFLSTEMRHVRQSSRAELACFDRSGRCLRVACVSGVQPRLLASTPDGARALVAVPGHLMRDPWRCSWIPLEPSDLLEPMEVSPIALEAAFQVQAGRGASESWGDFTGAVQARETACWLLWRDGRLSVATSPDLPPEPLLLPELEGVRSVECLSIEPKGRFALLWVDRQRVALLALEPRRIRWQSGVSQAVGAWCSGQGDVRVLTAAGEVLEIAAEGAPSCLGRLVHPAGGGAGTFAWGVSVPDGGTWVSAVGRALVLLELRTGEQRSGQPEPLVGDRGGPLDADVRREYLPPVRYSDSGRWRLSILRDWEMTDPYQSADCWFLLAEEQWLDASEGPRALERFHVRLPEQPFVWGEEPVPGIVLLRDMRGAWMAIHLGRRKAFPLASPRGSVYVALCGGGWRYVRRSGLGDRSEQALPPVPRVESVDLQTGYRLHVCPCREAELPLAGSSDASWVLLQDGPRLRVLQLERGDTLRECVLEADEADEAVWQEPGGFWVRTRRGAEVFLTVG